MLAAERRRRLTELVETSGVVSTEDLATHFDVSPETIRRDIVALDRAGYLLRVHGGAMTRQRDAGGINSEPPFVTRVDNQREAKVRIGRLAASMVGEHDVVAIDTGTTAIEIARALPAEFKGVIATSSVRVAYELGQRDGVEVLLSGGRVRTGDMGCSSSHAVNFFRDVNTDIAFISSGGVTVDSLTDYYQPEVEVRRAIMRNARRSIVTADATKIGRVAPFRVCDLGDLDGLITDVAPPAALRAELTDNDVKVYVAEAG